MEKESVLEKLNCIIGVYANDTEVQANKDIMGKPLSLLPYEVAALFLDIEKEFAIDLDKLVPKLVTFSPNEIAERLATL